MPLAGKNPTERRGANTESVIIRDDNDKGLRSTILTLRDSDARSGYSSSLPSTMAMIHSQNYVTVVTNRKNGSVHYTAFVHRFACQTPNSWGERVR